MKQDPRATKIVLWFEEVDKTCIPLVGGKGANLGELTKAGIPVPGGYNVAAYAYGLFLRENRLDRLIQQLLSGLKPEDTKELNIAAHQLDQAFKQAKMPLLVQKAIVEAYRKLCPAPCFVAVRSSATAEDLPNASFAGQQVTFLNVRGEIELLESVKKCWASLFLPRAIYYRSINHFDHLQVKIAVPVQKMIQSDVAGVIFTVDPMTQDRTKIDIEAAWGLGEVVVSGMVTPDRYLVDKRTGQIVERKIAQQSWQIRWFAGLNRHLIIPKPWQKKPKLSDEQIRYLAQLAIKIEAHYQAPQDCEWAIEEGKVYFVQARPITTLGQKSKIINQKQENQAAEISQITTKPILTGIGASMGVVSGPVKIIHSAQEIEKVLAGDILVTEMTSPDFVPAMRKAAAIVTDTGGRTSHAAIVSREIGIPCIVGTGQATVVLKSGSVITIDGASGRIWQGKIAEKINPEIKPLPSRYQREAVPKTATKVYLNLAEPEKALEVAKLPADGVGLLRAEFMIAALGRHPKELMAEGKIEEYINQLTAGIRKIAQAFTPRPIVYRATDFKTNEYRGLEGGEKYETQEANPMMGYRGALRYRQDPELFEAELEAIKRCQREGLANINLMIPFVRTVKEFLEVKKIITQSGLVQGPNFKLWIMVEVPSTVFLIDKFIAAGINGVSIGSNDLAQLILGADRDNAKLSAEYDERDPAVVMAMQKVISACRKSGVTSSICGEAPANYPEIVEILIKAGVTSVSVNPGSFYETKKLVASIERGLRIQ